MIDMAVHPSEVSDDFMKSMRGTAGDYTLVILKASTRYGQPDSDKIIWEHGRRNHALRLSGLLPIVCPVLDESDICGIGLFALSPDDVQSLMEEDPGVEAGVFTYEVHPIRGFPGDALP